VLFIHITSGHGGGHWQLRLSHPARVSRWPGRRLMV
jgi:hypothetical protein